MNQLQEARLQTINDRWPVATWHEQDGMVVVQCDDGDEAEIHADGTANWRSANTQTTNGDHNGPRHPASPL